MILRVLFCLIVSQAAARGDDATVHIRGKAVKIPAPDHFVRYDGKSDKIDVMQGSFVPATNHILAAFAEPADLEKVMAGAFPKLMRSFNAQENKQFEEMAVTQEEFEKIQEALRSQMEVLKNSVSSPVSDIEKSASTAMSREVAGSLRVKVGEVFPLGVFGETKEATCFSMLVKSAMIARPPDKTIDPTTVIAGCVMLVQDRLLYLYANSDYQGKLDSNWARQQVVEWRDAVLAANSMAIPPAQETETLPSEPLAEPDLPWWKKKGRLPGAIAAIVLLGWLMIRQKPLKLPD